MKKSAILGLALSLQFVISSFVSSPYGDCTPFFPMKEGASLKYEDYDAKEKLTGSQETIVLSKKESPGKIEVEVKMTSFDKKGKETYTTEYPITCENGKFNVSMKNMIPAEQMSAYQSMSVSFDADNLVIPSDAKAGTSLPDAKMKITSDASGMAMALLTVEVTNRKIEAEEKITVPAGTFDTFKLTYEVSSKVMMINVSTKVTEWFAHDIGTIRQETYKASNGKLMSKRLLVKADIPD